MENTLPHRLDDTIRNDDTVNCYTPTRYYRDTYIESLTNFIELNKIIDKPKRDDVALFTTP